MNHSIEWRSFNHLNWRMGKTKADFIWFGDGFRWNFVYMCFHHQYFVSIFQLLFHGMLQFTLFVTQWLQYQNNSILHWNFTSIINICLMILLFQTTHWFAFVTQKLFECMYFLFFHQKNFFSVFIRFCLFSNFIFVPFSTVFQSGFCFANERTHCVYIQHTLYNLVSVHFIFFFFCICIRLFLPTIFAHVSLPDKFRSIVYSFDRCLVLHDGHTKILNNLFCSLNENMWSIIGSHTTEKSQQQWIQKKKKKNWNYNKLKEIHNNTAQFLKCQKKIKK